MQRDQREKLLQLRRPEVTAFLENHGDILWVDQSQREQFLQAAETLATLAASQKESFGFVPCSLRYNHPEPLFIILEKEPVENLT